MGRCARETTRRFPRWNHLRVEASSRRCGPRRPNSRNNHRSMAEPLLRTCARTRSATVNVTARESRLRGDLQTLEMLRQSSSVFSFDADGDPPDRYTLSLRGKGICAVRPSSGAVEFIELHQIDMRLPFGLPGATAGPAMGHADSPSRTCRSAVSSMCGIWGCRGTIRSRSMSCASACGIQPAWRTSIWIARPISPRGTGSRDSTRLRCPRTRDRYATWSRPEERTSCVTSGAGRLRRRIGARLRKCSSLAKTHQFPHCPRARPHADRPRPGGDDDILYIGDE